MCLPKPPKVKETVTETAPEPEKAPLRIESKDAVTGDKKKRRSDKLGTQALRSELKQSTVSGSGLSIPRS